MNLVERALWYIESHTHADLTLDKIADSVCVSRYHLLRSFSAATGLSIMRYVRGRRLTEAAHALVSEASMSQDILSLAIQSGYHSHEAFTRAFKEFFGVTPESVRAQKHLQNLNLLEAISMQSHKIDNIPAPRIETGRLMLLAGISQHYAGVEAGAGIPAQWQRFSRYLGHIEGQMGNTTYGVCYNTDDEANMDYLSCVEVRDFSSLPEEFARLRLPPQRYAVFFHAAHISSIRGTWNAIWNDWLPTSGHRAADVPLFERYDERFNPATGNGGVELWVPITD